MNQYPAARPRKAYIHSASVVGRGAAAASAPSTEVWIDVITAMPTADPSWRAQLRIAPIVPAAEGGV
jgi:hypothetical protein